jgi:hypothetical protein
MARLAPRGRWISPTRGSHLAEAAILCAATALGCARTTLPDPEVTARAYADAARDGDAEAIHGMLTTESQRDFGLDGTRRRVADSASEIARQGEALAGDQIRVETEAVIRFADGERATLVVEDGEFKVASAGVLPAGARTPAEALAELRQALARRSYASLLRVLDAESRGAIEDDLRTLVIGLEEPDTLDVKIAGDAAEVSLPGGHWVKLKREAGVWKVEDFD